LERLPTDSADEHHSFLPLRLKKDRLSSPIEIMPSKEQELTWMKAREAGIIGESEALYKSVESALNAAPTEISILICGANGTGKELLARLIHDYSRASPRQFLAINCASISPDLFESEMFGHEKGSFTGASNLKKGAFELAHGGTLFLDELGEMPLGQQAKLLRVMQTGTCRRVGSNSAVDDIEARPRIIAATNIDVREALRKGKLREDLFYRLNRRIELPSLAERRSDIPILANNFLTHFIKDYGEDKKSHPASFTPSALKLLQSHPWPGNIRELRGVVENAFIDARGRTITDSDLSILTHFHGESEGGLPEPHEGFDSKHYLQSVRDQLYFRALELAGQNTSAASRLLGISKQALTTWKDNQG
jgi:transcriptional regulator with PAS, ATPase and Fis domain